MKSLKQFLEKDYSLPPFSIKVLGYTLLLLILPNLFLLMVAYLTDTARPLFNVDYLLAAMLFTFPWKPIRWLGIPAFLLAVGMDMVMFVMQLFPFMDLASARYLISFLPDAPVLYQVALVMGVVYCVLMSGILKKLGNYASGLYTFILSIVIAFVGNATAHLYYVERPETLNGLFGRANYFYIESQYVLYSLTLSGNFMESMQITPRFDKLPSEQAMSQVKLFQSPKFLLIMNESWGEPKNAALQEAVLEKLSQLQSTHLTDWQRGSFLVRGSTVTGEMRELCAMDVTGYAFQQTPAEQLAHCLPNQFVKQGYTTIALHGSGQRIYDRFSLYPKVGFQQFVSSEHLMDKKRCVAFGGVCDAELFSVVQRAFGQSPKLFYYWLTLTSHSTYPEKDIYNHRLNCQQYGLSDSTDLCRNFKLQAQFFDELSNLVQQPEMKGTEVLIVGDHAPPVFDARENRVMQANHVAWLHFKIKE